MNQPTNSPSRIEDSLQFFASDLFHDVQMCSLFKDSKTFADACPKIAWAEIYVHYDARRQQAGFNLAVFVEEHFTVPIDITLSNDGPASSVVDCIESLWPKLERPADKPDCSSLVPLTQHYIVPGGRFREIYYWDSYFTALGLLSSGRIALVKSMVTNFIELQDKFGFIPNGNRSYYHTRSQPPVLGLMIELLMDHFPFDNIVERRNFLAYCVAGLEKEHQFWMQGKEQLNAQCQELRRVVQLPDGSILNRYWDDSATPRPESYREDIESAAHLSVTKRKDFYRNIRAACESGWDFSSRWLAQANNLHSIQTTRLVPIDLNCLLYKLEILLGQFHSELENKSASDHYKACAASRHRAIEQYLWSEQKGLYCDYLIDQNQQSDVASLATVIPLFVKIASQSQADKVKQAIIERFLVKGGLTTTSYNSEQQWDAPNGWAPLHWFAVMGLQHYHFCDAAITIMQRWLATVEQYFAEHNHLMEKYNVMQRHSVAAGGEYIVQQGFGWTNGVSLAFYHLLEEIDPKGKTTL
ncbi:MAG: alpha,alpha-trehalase [Paraglaciecola sp.]|jgi:alpha,alpha-trehalase